MSYETMKMRNHFELNEKKLKSSLQVGQRQTEERGSRQAGKVTEHGDIFDKKPKSKVEETCQPDRVVLVIVINKFLVGTMPCGGVTCRV